MGLSAKTIVKFNKLFREVIIEHILCNSQPIGGPGIIVQIDETLVFKRKYNHGRNIQQIWIVRGIAPETNNFFLRQVPNRNSETIINVLEEWVHPDSILYTDCWRVYLNASIDSGMFAHFTVNHE